VEPHGDDGGPLSDVPIAGAVAPGFEAVRVSFAENFVSRGEVGAAMCVRRHGEVIVDLWGGWADEARTAPWRADTLVDMYSVGKALVGTLLLQLVDTGELSLDTTIADVWPEFAAHGKHAVTVRHALCHEATVPAIRTLLTDEDLVQWDTMAAALADTPPWWPLGTRHAYHTNTYGHLIGETVRRATGMSPGTLLARLSQQLEADVHIGVPDDDLARCAEVIWAPPNPVPPIDTIVAVRQLDGDALMNVLAHFNPPGYSSIGVVNTRSWRQAQVPSTNAHGSARGLAAFYGGLLDDARVLSHEMITTATQPQATGPCPILGEDLAFGLGFQPTSERRPLGTNPRSFGHFGTGGALGFADPDAGIAFGYVMNHVIPRWQSTRNRALIDSLYACLDAE
jgi:CubicO group peptidase (beta-lactamase class C family)